MIIKPKTKQIITVLQRPLYDGQFNRILDVPKNAVFEIIDTRLNGGDEYYQVDYRGNVGWLRAAYTDPYHTTNKTDIVYLDDIATEDKNDPAQFVMWHNTSGNPLRCVNQCGEICASAILGKPLSETLAIWESSASWYYQYTFQNSDKDRGTGEDALKDLLKAHGIKPTVSVSDFFELSSTARTDWLRFLIRLATA